jgi:hypothetical protein
MPGHFASGAKRWRCHDAVLLEQRIAKFLVSGGRLVYKVFALFSSPEHRKRKPGAAHSAGFFVVGYAPACSAQSAR